MVPQSFTSPALILSKTNESSTGDSIPPDIDGSSLNGDEDALDFSTHLHAVSVPTSTGTGQSIQPSQVTAAESPQQTIHTAPSNESIHQLSPFFVYGCRIFLDICSGVSKPLSVALCNLNRTVLAIDLLLHSSMNLLNDEFFEQLLRLCGSGLVAYCSTAPNCGLYSLLRLRPGGPRA